MTTETELLALTTNISTLVQTVNTQQTNINTVLGNLTDAIDTVDNLVSDENKIISNLTQAALDTKQVILDSSNLKTINDIDLLSPGNISIERGMMEMPITSYDNRLTLRTPQMSARPAQDDTMMISGLGLFQFRDNLTLFDDGNMAINVTDPTDGITVMGQWYLETAAYDWLEVTEMFHRAILTDWMEDEPLRAATY
jgi:hypothetical protein